MKLAIILDILVRLDTGDPEFHQAICAELLALVAPSHPKINPAAR
jgi:hypothetical protein